MKDSFLPVVFMSMTRSTRSPYDGHLRTLVSIFLRLHANLLDREKGSESTCSLRSSTRWPSIPEKYINEKEFRARSCSHSRHLKAPPLRSLPQLSCISRETCPHHVVERLHDGSKRFFRYSQTASTCRRCLERELSLVLNIFARLECSISPKAVDYKPNTPLQRLDTGGFF